MYDTSRARRVAHETHVDALQATETAIMLLSLCDTFAIPCGHPKRVKAELAYDHAAAAELAATMKYRAAVDHESRGSFVL